MKRKLSLLAIFILSFVFVCTVNGSIRSFNKRTLDEIKILAEEKTDVTGDGQAELILKMEYKGVLYFEIYELKVSLEGEKRNLLLKIPFPEYKDGFIFYKNTMSNLILDDFNNDNLKDIVLILYDSGKRMPFKKIYTWDQKKKVIEEIF
ncbi:MAG TPA: hypothetical protein VJB34_03165 [Bdellovibrionota bacterium]|nr:hypothetical protein [Bdellovibrionota bacterium]